MAYEEYLNWEDFKKSFGAATPFETLRIAGNAIENLPDWDLEALIHLLYDKYPHLPETFKGRCEILKKGVRRAVLTRFFKELYGREPGQHIIDRNDEVILALNLHDTPYVPPQKEVKALKTTAKEKVVKEKPQKSIKVKSEFAQKVSEMTLEDLIKWAIQLGVDPEKINKHITKPLGLAKMNISNMVKAKLP